MRSRHVAGGLALTVAAFGLGILTALPSQAAACPTYADPKGDTGLTTAAGTVPVSEPSLDIVSFGFSSTVDSLTGFLTVDKLAERPTTGLGNEFGVTFKLGEATYELWSGRNPEPLNTVFSVFTRSGVRVNNTNVATPVTAVRDAATNTVSISVKFADLDKVTKVATKGQALTVVSSRARADNGAVLVNYELATAPEKSTYVAGTVCTLPAGPAPAAPAPSGSAAPSASASASAAPSASASASAAPSATATGGPAEPTGSTSPSAAPKPTPTRASTPKTNPGCGAAPAGSSSASPSPAASSDEQRTPTTLSLSSNATRIRACNTPLLSGIAQDLQGRVVRGAEITISAKAITASAYTDVATVVTDESGRFTLQVRPLVTTSYLATAEDSAESPAMSIDVATRVVISSPRADSATGRTVTLRGHLVPGHGSAPVVLGYVRGGRFVELSRGATDSKGFFRLSGQAPNGRYTFSVATPARRTNLAGQESVTLTVQ